MGRVILWTMYRLLFLALVLTFHLFQGEAVEENPGKVKKCPLSYKKRGKAIKPFQCMDLKPPGGVEDALQTCWKEAINIDFKCMSRQTIISMMRKAAQKRQNKKKPPSRGSPGPEKANNAPKTKENRGGRKSGSRSTKKGNRRRVSWKTRMQYYRRRALKMIILRHLLSNLNWWIFFTKDVAPPVFPLLVPELQSKVKDRFRNCFSKKTGIEFGDKINTEQVIDQLKLYKGHESNITLLVNLTRQCSKDTTYQSEFSQCMTRNMAVLCIKKYVTEYWNKWRSRYMKTEKTGTYQLTDKKAEDRENDHLTNQIEDVSKSKGDGYSDKRKSLSIRKGRSADDDG